MSNHSTLRASRVKAPELNKWCYDFAASKKYAIENRVPFIAIWTEGDGCGHCQILASCLVQSEFKNWMKTSGCIFWLGAAEDKWADNKKGEKSAGFMWASRNLEITGYPFVRIYWKPGKVDKVCVGDSLDDNKADKDGAKAVVKNLKNALKDYDPNAVPASPADDIKLLSGKNGCTAQTDPDVTEKDDIAITKHWLTNRLYTHYACASGPDGYPFNGWSSHSSTGSWLAEKGPAFGVKTALADIKKLSEANGRPLFVIYGKAGNKGSCAFNVSFDNWSRAGTGSLTQLSKCQEGAADPKLKLGNHGFYFVYYFNDKDETCPEANEAKKFITQFGDIKTGYPWYIAYCKYQDKHVYARYGSLPSANVLAGGYTNQNEDIAAIYGDFCTFAKNRGQEIQYTWTGGQGSAPSGDGVFANRKAGVTENFVTGQWYQFGSGGGLQKFIDYAYATGLPVIAVGSTAKDAAETAGGGGGGGGGDVQPTADEEVLLQFIAARDADDEPIVAGGIRRDLSRCVEWAEQNGVPLVGIWSNEGCSACGRLLRAMSSDAFRERLDTSGILLCYLFNSNGTGAVTESDPEGERNGEGYHWCWGKGNDAIYKKVGSFPFVRLYWKKDGKQIVDKVVTGSTVVNNIGTDVQTGTMSDGYGTYQTVAGVTSNKAGAYAIDYMIRAFPGYGA